MSNGIPVTAYHDRETFVALERIAARSNTTVRELIAEGARIVAGTIHPTAQGTNRRTIAPSTVDEWVVAARSGVSNNAIAERYGVSKALVSLRLRERGIRRHRSRRDRKADSR